MQSQRQYVKMLASRMRSSLLRFPPKYLYLKIFLVKKGELSKLVMMTEWIVAFATANQSCNTTMALLPKGICNRKSCRHKNAIATAIRRHLFGLASATLLSSILALHISLKVRLHAPSVSRRLDKQQLGDSTQDDENEYFGVPNQFPLLKLHHPAVHSILLREAQFGFCFAWGLDSCPYQTNTKPFRSLRYVILNGCASSPPLVAISLSYCIGSYWISSVYPCLACFSCLPHVTILSHIQPRSHK